MALSLALRSNTERLEKAIIGMQAIGGRALETVFVNASEPEEHPERLSTAFSSMLYHQYIYSSDADTTPEKSRMIAFLPGAKRKSYQSQIDAFSLTEPEVKYLEASFQNLARVGLPKVSWGTTISGNNIADNTTTVVWRGWDKPLLVGSNPSIRVADYSKSDTPAVSESLVKIQQYSIASAFERRISETFKAAAETTSPEYTKEWKNDGGLSLKWENGLKFLCICIEPMLEESYWYALDLEPDKIVNKRGLIVEGLDLKAVVKALVGIESID